MIWPHCVPTLAIVSVLAAAQPCVAQTAPDQPRKIVVATKEAPPFAIKDDNGRWTGVSIDLWRDIANELNLEYEIRELDLNEMIDSLKDHSSDVAVAALTITQQREQDIDFSHPFYTSGLGIAVASKESSGVFSAVYQAMASWEFVEILVALVLALLSMGFLIWLFERKRNRAHFGGSVARGLGSGFWWSAVTMTTVGYGDKVPITVAGRLVALLWMFSSLIVISFFTASVASLILVDRLESSVTGLRDLPHVRVASIRGTTSEVFLQNQRINAKPYDSPREALRALRDGEMDAVVHDAPLLRYAIRQQFRGELAVLRIQFETQNYGIGMPSGSELREPINRSLLRITSEPDWQNTIYRYLGE